MITDQKILTLIQDRLLIKEDGVIYKFHNQRKKYVKLNPRKDERKGYGRYRYWIRIKSETRTIMRNKLFWMMEHKKLVPVGYDIDHKDYDKTNDDVSNLTLREESENRRDNTYVGFEKCMDFFNRIIARQHGSLGDF